jgi:predicted peptidase
MKTFTLSILITLLFITLQAQREHFSKEIFENDGKHLLYRFSTPENFDSDTNIKYPLILFLHGAGERGSDNEIQITYVDKIFGSEEFRSKYPCFVVVPQCPVDKRWVEVDWHLPSHIQPVEMSEPLKLTVALIFKIMRFYNVDKNRIYVVGLSMGGYGTWDLITRFPYLFAAGVPICGGGDENTASKIIDVPVWAFHGAKDNVVVVSRSGNMINAIKKAGGNPQYTEYPDKGHFVWDAAFNTPELWQWLFEQSKK